MKNMLACWLVDLLICCFEKGRSLRRGRLEGGHTEYTMNTIGENERAFFFFFGKRGGGEGGRKKLKKVWMELEMQGRSDVGNGNMRGT